MFFFCFSSVFRRLGPRRLQLPYFVLFRLVFLGGLLSVFLNDDNAINRKLRAVLRHNMKPILCIGETKSEYDAGLVKSVSCPFAACIARK